MSPAGFLNRVHYTAYASWNGLTTPILKTEEAGPAGGQYKTSSFAQRGDVTVEVNVPDGSSQLPLLAGTYGDTITLMIWIDP